MYSIEQTISKLKELAGDSLLKQKLPDEDFLKKLAGRIGFSLPPDYKKFLKEASNVIYGRLDLLTVNPEQGSNNELEQFINEMKESDYFEDVPLQGIPICEDNGDCYFILPDGKVVFWSHNGITDEQWPSLSIWIQEVWIEGN